MGNHIDVVAPGAAIISTWPTNTTSTSMAAPFVSGIAGLLRAYNANLYNDDIEQIIRLSADKVLEMQGQNFTTAHGYGRVNAKKALDYLRAPYTLQQLTASGATTIYPPLNPWPDYLDIPVYGVPGLQDGSRWDVFVYVVDRSVTFQTFSSTPYVWGRGVGTTGYPEIQSPDYAIWGMGWCEVVPGSITTNSATLRTIVYDLGNWVFIPEIGDYEFFSVGFFPAAPQNVSYNYTVLGIPSSPKAAESPMTENTLLPEDFILSQNFPNPFNPATAIRFGLPQDEHVQLVIIDLLGREVRKLVDNDFSAGYHSVVWNGKDNVGNVVPSGVYIYQIVAGPFRDWKKLALVR